MSLPRGYGGAVLSAEFRTRPEDFIVEELPAFEPSGEGEHLLLTIEKRGMNTVFVAKRIAQWGGIPEMGVGYAGMKDRHAVTRQRFSVHFPKRVSPDLAGLQSDDLRVLEHSWHNRKLPRGGVAGRRVVLTLRNVVGDTEAIETRLQLVRGGGIPNYFGEQRFGRDGRSRHPASRATGASMHGGDNVQAALRMFAGERVRREQRSIYLSAARSELFNAVLGARIAAGDWNTGADGEVWMLDGTQSVFGPEPATDAIHERAARQDIHPTGPMWGRGELRSQDAVQAVELAAVAPFAELCCGLEAAEMKQERRALRVRVRDLAWDWLDPATLRLQFALAPGSYATEMLAELGDVNEPPGVRP
jgi:tRNA pseudouridine13 synthase